MKEFKGTTEEWIRNGTRIHVKSKLGSGDELQIGGFFNSTYERNVANATIATAAPELLKALQSILEDVADDSLRRLYPEEFKNAESAIKKALG